MTKQIFILHGFDKVSEEYKPKGLRQSVCYVESPRTKPLIKGWLIGCCRVMKLSKSNDVIFCWYDFQAVLIYWICFLTGMKRRIACLNLLLKKKDTIMNSIVRFMYRKALKSERFHSSVTSPYYGEKLKEWLGINFNYIVIHDLFHEAWRSESTSNEFNKIFIGGGNGRDWPFMIEVAKKMPHVHFVAIMRRDAYEKYKDIMPNNVEVRTSIPFKEFLQEIANSAMVCLPVDTEAPAGLMVVYQAAACRKMVMITKTATSQEYVTQERGCALPNDEDDWVNAINYYLKHEDERQQKAIALYDYLRTNCGIKQYSEGIQMLIDMCE